MSQQEPISGKITLQEIPFGSTLHAKSILLRDKILRKPLGLKFEPQELEMEKDQHHLGLLKNNELFGILLLVPKKNEVKMRQVAIAAGKQGLGYGKQLVRYSEDFSREHGWSLITLHARISARQFYLSLGYQTDEIGFEEVGIPHIKMWKYLK